MVCQHHFRHVWLIAGALPWLCIAASGTEKDAARAILTDARRGNCITCHVIPISGVPADAFGNLGPSLTGLGSRLTPAQIKARIVDPRPLAPGTIMPAYGSVTGLYRVQNGYLGKPILTDTEIDTLVVYLSALK